MVPLRVLSQKNVTEYDVLFWNWYLLGVRRDSGTFSDVFFANFQRAPHRFHMRVPPWVLLHKQCFFYLTIGGLSICKYYRKSSTFILSYFKTLSVGWLNPQMQNGTLPTDHHEAQLTRQ